MIIYRKNNMARSEFRCNRKRKTYKKDDVNLIAQFASPYWTNTICRY